MHIYVDLKKISKINNSANLFALDFLKLYCLNIQVQKSY